MIKRKKHQQWEWTEKTDSGIQRYIKWKSKPHIQDRIYKEHIHYPLYKMAENLNVMRETNETQGHDKGEEFTANKASEWDTEHVNAFIKDFELSKKTKKEAADKRASEKLENS